MGTVEELFDVARGLASQPLPRGRRLLVVTNGGGLGIVATDAARDAGLEVEPLEAPVRERLMAPHGKELLLGMIRDPQFGPMVVVGFGGIYVEVLEDTAARLCPLDRCEALDMLDELRMAPLLDGARGEAPVNKDLLAEALCRFAQLAVDATDVAELEVNPLVAGPDGVTAVDARARME